VNRCWLEGWSSGCELRRGSAALPPELWCNLNVRPITNTHCPPSGLWELDQSPSNTVRALGIGPVSLQHRQGFGRKEKTALILSIYLIWWLLGLGDVGTHKVTQLQTTMLATFPRIHFITHTEEVSLASAEVLVRRWAPNVRMHRSTSFMPISAHDYVTHCAPPHDRWEAVISQPRLGQNVSLSPRSCAHQGQTPHGSIHTHSTHHRQEARHRKRRGTEALGRLLSHLLHLPLRTPTRRQGLWVLHADPEHRVTSQISNGSPSSQHRQGSSCCGPFTPHTGTPNPHGYPPQNHSPPWPHTLHQTSTLHSTSKPTTQRQEGRTGSGSSPPTSAHRHLIPNSTTYSNI